VSGFSPDIVETRVTANSKDSIKITLLLEVASICR